MDQILSLRAFVATAEHGSFSAAARELAVVPSVITKRINELEAAIGAPLFNRTTRSVATTSLGADHLEQARQLLRELDELIGGPSARPEDIEGRLRVKVPTALATIRLRPAFGRFQQMYPKIDLEIALIDRYISPIEDGYDLAIGVVQLHPGGAVEEVLCPLRRVVCASPEYLSHKGVPAHPRALSDHDCMTFFPTQSEWVFEKEGTVVRLALRPKFTSNNWLLLRTAALQGNGLTLMPDYVAGDALKTGELVRVLADWTVPPGEIRAVIPKHRASDLALRALLDVLKEELADIG
ncbi:LysR family transcriptional regulator [Trinickia dinghuensis]|uniref:LysR family transcriptional regulator n=1 Tax=Trinickia dinghuensis TaxID=2291023 RepID=A0A3D8K5Z5_9BURK|nr:LysR family transcriptional regulator [Trinickia dinghuensis]RDV00336.1 LysR family transcriptional regulator [Trinickia dinghuensis]